MDTWLKFVLLLVAAYLLGSIPLSYLTARSRGVDIRKRGTQQVGTGNLWRTTSHKLGFFVGIYDFLKGMLMVYFSSLAGLEPALQLFTGIAVVIGHNWPVFLRFHGGRGIATALGLIIILPAINSADIDVTIWPMIFFFGIGVGTLVFFHRTAVPVLIATFSLPIVSAIAKEPLLLTMGYLALLLIVITKRLTAQSNTEAKKMNMGKVFFYRFFFDRDIRDRAAWVYRGRESGKDIPE
jgi:acyl phosphate:glycerol-3-phosphate acyltransferase